MTNLGLYIHVPFCKQKCNYCDFYSFCASGEEIDSYALRVTEEIKKWGTKIMCPIDSLYLGGGTPSLLGGENIVRIVNTARDAFGFENPEITLEANPAYDLKETLLLASKSGVNRLSLGVQSANESELKTLGRRHRNADVLRTLEDAQGAGIDNISLDLMIGLPDSTIKSVKRSLDFVLGQNPKHISVYMLKIEEGTPFFEMDLNLPNEDETAKQYLFVCEYLEKYGIKQYEISNFAIPGFESRHNLRYWKQKNYLGIGPSAHSFLDTKRFYYPRDIKAFLSGTPVVFDGIGGDGEEYIMLRMRLCEGLNIKEYEEKFGSFKCENVDKLIKGGLMKKTENGFALTKEGFLVSNAVIGELI